jgi:purine nucleosidase
MRGTENRVWIDTDMGFDDMAAILTVAHSPDWAIDGLSLVAGNAPLPVVVDNALRAAAFFGWQFPIVAGRAAPLACELVTAQNVLGADGMKSAGRSLPQVDSAAVRSLVADGVAALAAHLAEARQPSTLLALGPLTNIAALLQREPPLAGRIGRLVWMGGSAVGGNVTAAAEFNAHVDPEAINEVLDAGVRIEMVGLDACRQVRVDASDAAALRQLGTDKSEVLADLLLGYVQVAAPDGSKPMWLYDPTAAAALVAPDAATWREARIVAECRGEYTRGMTVVEWRVPARGAVNASVATRFDEALVRRTVLDALAAACR